MHHRKQRKILMWNMKGGVAKTTTTGNLGYGLARHGNKVLVVDAGLQNNIAEWFNISVKQSLFDYAIGKYSYTEFRQAIKCGNTLNHSDLFSKIEKNLWVVSIVKNIEEVGQLTKENIFLGSVKKYLQLLCEMNDFDYIIFDMAPEITPIHNVLLNFADEIFIPVSMEFSALKGVIQVIKLTEILQSNAEISFIIPTFVDVRNRKTKEVLHMLKQYFGKEKLAHGIRICTKISEALGHHQSIYDYSPYCTGSDDYKILVKEVMKHEVHNNVRKSV